MEVKLGSGAEYLHATLTGSLSLKDLLQAFETTYDAAVSRGLRCILIDCSGLDGELSTMDRYSLGESGIAYWSSRLAQVVPKIAVVGKPPVIDGFAALVASNRGIDASTFSEIQRALDWLGVPAKR